MTPTPWPYPGDNPLDQRERIARAYRKELKKFAPTACATLDRRCRELGHGWVSPQPLTYDLEDIITAAEVAEMCHVQAATVRQWRRRGLAVIRTPDGFRYRVADVLDYHAERRYRRAQRTAPDKSTGLAVPHPPRPGDTAQEHAP